MAGVNLKIIPFGDDKVQAELERMINAVRNPTHALREIGEHLDFSHRLRFDRQVSPEGVKWQPLSALTTLKRKKNPRDILVGESYLRDTLRYQVTDRGLLFGTDRPYGAVHQFGARQGAFGRSRRNGPIPWGDIPARPWLGTSDDDLIAIRDIIQRHLTG